MVPRRRSARGFIYKLLSPDGAAEITDVGEVAATCHDPRQHIANTQRIAVCACVRERERERERVHINLLSKEQTLCDVNVRPSSDALVSAVICIRHHAVSWCSPRNL